MKKSHALLASLTLLAACGRQIDSNGVPASLEAATTTTTTLAQPVSPAPVEPAVSSFKTVLYSEHDAEVTARMDGVVRATNGELGSAVQAGAVLAVLEDEREAAAVQSAEAAAELARVGRARAQTLIEGQMISQVELEAAIYKEKAADAALRDAQVRLGYTRVRAPFGGRVAQQLVRVGQTVRAGDPMFRVTAPRPLRAAVRLSELEARQLRVGRSVQLHGLDGVVVNGRIARIAPTVDASSGTVEVLVDVDQPRSLTAGSTVTVAIK